MNFREYLAEAIDRQKPIKLLISGIDESKIEKINKLKNKPFLGDITLITPDILSKAEPKAGSEFTHICNTVLGKIIAADKFFAKKGGDSRIYQANYG